MFFVHIQIHMQLRGCWSDGIIDILSSNFLQIGFIKLNPFSTHT